MFTCLLKLTCTQNKLKWYTFKSNDYKKNPLSFYIESTLERSKQETFVIWFISYENALDALKVNNIAIYELHW